ncbi:MAG: transcription termination factor NusA [Synergistales bacterium]|jgi:N utilization substance protein A|nr:transcription termination/antitermination protein NusA [Bacteroidales bacterium]MDY6434920.1 transcription termination factor NusA [Synergistales bacterium]MDY6380954.1 transcription termination factor NusA [Bacteroidales bacterium]MDY6394753.1 transcription termination factor NusA [Bacteroidales bacterium]MDY6395168.1 transcription termination factor NusA [Bacteroidales bacterium]
MEKLSLIDSFAEFKEYKGIDTETLMRILEDVLRGLLAKKYGTDKNIDIIVNVDKGDLEIWRNRTIVEDDQVTDSSTQVPYSEAIKIEPDFEVGEELSEEIRFADFGRRDILSIRQNLIGKVQEYDRARIYNKYKEKVGNIIVCEVYQVWKKEIMVIDEDGIELTLPKQEQIPGDFFRKGDAVKGIVLKVEMKNGIPNIILSRVSPIFLERLFENEVPEIFDGLITIKNTVRQPGERAKIAVESYDDRIDPVGACVGMKGSRIHGIVRELRNENIDVINYTTNAELYVARALSPAQVISVTIHEDTKKADVFMKPDQVSLAIGKGGYNIRLASKLTGYEIDVYRDSDMEYEDDVDLQEFSDEIELWIIEALKSIGCDTAKDVLALSKEDVAERADLEQETVENVFNILRAEFEDESANE